MKAWPIVLSALVCSTAIAQSKPAARATIASQVQGVLASIKSESDLDRAGTEIGAIFREVLASTPSSDADAFRAAAFADRLLSQVRQTPAGHRAELVTYLRANDALAQSLVFLIKPEDDVKRVYALLDQLRHANDDLNDLAPLAAAVCVVHDKPLRQNVNENKVEAPDPVEIFAYFKSQRGSMAMPIASMPPELLISVVDVTSPIEELRWAAQRFGGDPNVGRRYFDVKYDDDSFRKGTVKKVTAAGFNLPNILTHGGVCADQAYFAAQVGKAIGIPTAFISGRNAEVAHAWLGFLEAKGGKAAWNFDSGRYDGYKGVRGEAIDPQTRKRIPDSALALIADSSAANTQGRRIAIAMTDASLRLRQLGDMDVAFERVDPATGKERKVIRGTDTSSRLDLLEAGLRRCPSYSQGWAVLIDAAKANDLSLKDKKKWAETLDRLCAGKYPDFTLDVLRPMVETVEDVKEQDALWNSLFGSFRNRPDLAAEIRFAQGAMWDKAGDRARAWDCFQDVIQKFADDGPFTVEAAERCEKLLKDAGKERDITPMYASLWPRLSRPGTMAPEFQSQSNWFRIGLLYSARLESEGQSARAGEVLGKLGVSKK